VASLSRKPKADEDADNSGLPSGFPVGYAPEQPPEILETGQGKLIKAGSDLVLELHDVIKGAAATDRSKFGLVFARGNTEATGPHLVSDERKMQNSSGGTEPQGGCGI